MAEGSEDKAGVGMTDDERDGPPSKRQSVGNNSDGKIQKLGISYFSREAFWRAMRRRIALERTGRELVLQKRR